MKAGYVGLGGLVAVENVFPPIPSEVILPMAGFLTGQDRLNYFMAVGATTAGAVVGALVYYELGRRVGQRRTRRFFEKHGKWMLASECDFDRASDWFRDHGAASVMLGRCVPGIRSLVSLPAGIQKMPVTKFIMYTALGSMVYNALLIGLGWLLGHNWQRVSEYSGWLETGVWVLLGAAVVWWIYKRKFAPGASRRNGCVE